MEDLRQEDLGDLRSRFAVDVIFVSLDVSFPTRCGTRFEQV